MLDPADAADLLDLVREEQGLARAGRRTPRKGLLLDLYSRSVNTGRPLSETLAETAPWAADLVEPIADVIKAYVARKRSRALLDFDDLLLYWRAAVRDDVLGRRLAGLFDAVLVDEYQDVNQLQVDIVRGLCAGDTGLTVVGDDAQAVYGFRGASARHILDLPAQFPGTTVVRLVRNYRSTQPILDLANAAWAGASVRYAKDLVAVRAGGVRPELVDCADEATQAEEVCARVLAARERGSRLRDQAVLFRAGRGSDLLELELTRRRIPYVKYGGLRYLEAAHVKDLLALYRLADNPRDETAWFRLLQLLDGVGPATARRVVDALDLDRDGVLDRWDAAGLPECARADAGRLVTALRDAGPGAGARRLRRALVPVVQGAYPDAAAGWPTWSGWPRRPPSTATCARSWSSWPSTRRGPPAPTRCRRASTRTGWCCPRCTRPRAWSGTRCTCCTSPRAASPPTWACPHRTVWTRSAGCSTSRSPGPATRCTCTRRCATTTTRGPGTTGTRTRSAAGSSTRPRSAAATGSARGAGDRAGRCARRLGDRAGPHGRGGARRALGLARVARRYVELEPDRLAEAAVVRLDAPPVGHRLDQVQAATGGVPAADLDQLRAPVAGVGHPDPHPAAGQSHGDDQLVPALPDRVGHQLGGQQRRRVERVPVDQVPEQIGDQPAGHPRALRVRRQLPPHGRAGRGPVADQLADQHHGVVRRRPVHQLGERVGQLVRPHGPGRRRPRRAPAAALPRCRAGRRRAAARR